MIYKTSLRGRCYQLSLNLIKLIDGLPKQRSCWVIADQLIRCGTSIGANLVEGTASSSRLEFKKFFEIALKSANETKYWLNLLKDSNKTDNNELYKLLKEVGEISNMIASGVIKLKTKRFF